MMDLVLVVWINCSRISHCTCENRKIWGDVDEELKLSGS